MNQMIPQKFTFQANKENWLSIVLIFSLMIVAEVVAISLGAAYLMEAGFWKDVVIVGHLGLVLVPGFVLSATVRTKHTPVLGSPGRKRMDTCSPVNSPRPSSSTSREMVCCKRTLYLCHALAA